MKFNNYKNSYNSNLRDIFDKMNRNSKKAGLAQMTPPTQDILLDPTGAKYLKRQGMYFTRAGLESGRYKREKNEKYRENYIKALEKLPNKNKWAGIIGRISLLNTTEDIWNVLPPLKDWYPQKKLFKGSDLPSVASYKGETDIDLLQEALYADLDESLTINGV